MNALIPFDDLARMGTALAKSGLFGMKSAEQAIALMLVAQAEGQHPATIAQDYDIIQGRAARKTHSVLARFQQAGGSVQWHELTDTKAHATFSHPQGGSVPIAWTIDQAKKIGLTSKDNWKNYPRAMLRARCIAEGVRAVYPAAIGGMLVSEEARDTYAPAPKNMGAAEIVQPEADDMLLQSAQTVADQGTEAYRQWWQAANKDARTALMGQHETLKARAAEVDRARPALPPAAPAEAVDQFVAEMEAAEAAGAHDADR